MYVCFTVNEGQICGIFDKATFGINLVQNATYYFQYRREGRVAEVKLRGP